MHMPATVRTPSYQYPQTAGSPAIFGATELPSVPMSFAKDAEIYGENEPAEYVYKVLSGAVRVSKVLQDGRRQIEAFYFAGDVFGMEFSPDHLSSAEAISPVSIIMVKRSTLLQHAERDAQIAKQLWQHTAQELEHARRHAMLLVKTAQERVASFLVGISARLVNGSVELPMSRQDIADYLGLTIETVSRTLTLFQKTSAIEFATSRRMIVRNKQALINLDS